MKFHSSSFLSLFLYVLNIISETTGISYELELLQVLFRHGDRTPDEKEIYKTDPYADIFREIGFGQLTNIGKERAYKIGRVLRERYDGFLGDYRAGEVNAYSTNLDRTKMSLDLVLAGMYPPTCFTKWSNEVLWSPIPTRYNSTRNDFFRSFINFNSYKKLHAEAANSTEFRSYLQQHQNLIDKVKKITDFDLSDYLTIAYTHNNLKSVVSLGLPLPDWCTQSDYERLGEIAMSLGNLASTVQKLASIVAGPAIEKYLNNIAVHEAGADGTKVHLYSAHEYNVVPFRNCHGFDNVPKSSEFGDAVVVEKLRGSDKRVYLRMSLWTGTSERWIPMIFPNGRQEYPLSEYENMMTWALPNKASRKCYLPNPSCKE